MFFGRALGATQKHFLQKFNEDSPVLFTSLKEKHSPWTTLAYCETCQLDQHSCLSASTYYSRPVSHHLLRAYHCETVGHYVASYPELKS
jgi:hypothetical protein